MLNQKIIELKKSIIEEANLVKEMIELSVNGLLEKNEEKLDKTFELEDLVNLKEIEIDERCIALIALHQPEAKNLRTILMILKMNNDLERMGDLAIGITKSARYLISKPFVKQLIHVPKMAEETCKMVEGTINAFVNEDIQLAKDVCSNDDTVDELKEQTYRLLLTYMLEDSSTIKRCIHINKISSNLERIADLSTNIAEETIFMAEGTIIKHNIQDAELQKGK
ncbi:MAG: hypothetical protein APR54_05220 [Candidatus Cloacimonas sp. SDB]|nr:MAG: hypothetical protein APR54_05220 [Candidatus Cloacimonas sp. SDB]